MKTCDLKEIIYLPSGIFTYTSIKTCIFYFIKKRDGNDVLETKFKGSKKEYKFSKTHQTSKVKFYDYNPYEDIKNLLVEVPIEKIAINSYSLNYAEYMKDETEDEKYGDDIIVKTLGEVSIIENGKRIVKSNVEIGEYPVLGGGGFTSFYTNEFTREGKTCKISREGMSLHNCVMILNQKYYLNSQAFTIKTNNEKIIVNEYLWYYLNNNKDLVFKCGRGTAQKAINIDEFKSIKIPIPSLEKQNEIIEYLDFIYENANKTSVEKIKELKKLNEFCLKNQKIFGENIVKELGNVFKEVKTGKDVVANDRKKGKYPFYGANGIIDYVDNYLFDGRYLLTARTGSLGSLHISNGKIWCSGDVHRIEFENDTLLSYTYYYLQTIDFQKFRTGSAHPKLSGSSLKSIKIPIPSIEKQKEIVEYCEFNDELIKNLEKEIENNKKQAEEFINSMIK